MIVQRPAPHLLVLQDRPGCFWALGFFFAAIGALFLAGVAGLFTNADDLSLGERAVITFLGAAAVATGGYLIHRSPGSRITFDADANRMSLTQYWLFIRDTRIIALSDIVKTYVESGEDSDGDPVYRPAIRLYSGGEIALSTFWLHDQAGVERILAEVEAFLAGNQDQPMSQ